MATEIDRLGLLAVVGLTLLIAGCMGGSGGEDVNETAVEAASTSVNDTPASAAGSLSFEGPTAEQTLVESGTFAAQDGAFVGGALRDADTRSHDLTPLVPGQAPVTVNVTITYSGEASQLNGDMVYDGVEVYETHYFKNFNTNTIFMEATLAQLSGGSVTAIVQADLTGESAERSYELTATVRSHGSQVLPRVPVSVPVTGTSGGFELSPTNGSSLPSAMVWGPDGEFVTRLTGGSQAAQLEVTGEDPTGRYVVLPGPVVEDTGGEPPTFDVSALNASQAPEDPLQVVGLQARQGDWHTVEPNGEATWTVNRPSPPARAAMIVRPASAFGVQAHPSEAIQATLTSPAGPVVEGGLAGIFFTNAEFQWISPVGQENLAPGTYEATASVGAGTPMEAAHVFYELNR